MILDAFSSEKCQTEKKIRDRCILNDENRSGKSTFLSASARPRFTRYFARVFSFFTRPHVMANFSTRFSMVLPGKNRPARYHPSGARERRPVRLFLRRCSVLRRPCATRHDLARPAFEMADFLLVPRCAALVVYNDVSLAAVFQV